MTTPDAGFLDALTPLVTSLEAAAARGDEDGFLVEARRLVRRVEAPDPVVATLLPFLGRRRGVGRAAAHALAELGAAAAEGLTRTLGHGGPQAQVHAAWALGSLPGGVALPALLGALARPDASADVLEACLASLAELAAREAAEPLLAVLHAPRMAAHRASLCRAIGLTGEPGAVAAMLGFLDEVDGPVRLQAAAAVARLGDARGVPVLVDLLRQDGGVPPGTAEVLRDLGDFSRAAPLLIGEGDQGYTLRRDAAEALGVLGDPRALPALLEARTDPNPWVRGAAAYALGRLGDRRVLPTLVLMLGDASDWVKGCAARSLGLLGDPGAIRALARAAESGNIEVASAAREAIGALQA